MQHVYEFLKGKYSIIIDEEQENRVIKLLTQRLQDSIDGIELLKMLDVSQESEGAGLEREDAKHMVKDLELIQLLRYKQ